MPSVQTEYSDITLIVVKFAIRQQAENAAIVADPEGGAGTFIPGVPLRVAGDTSNTVAAVWARWNMKKAQRSTFAVEMGGPNNIIAAGGNVPAFSTSRDRWFFDAVEGAWTPDQVLGALGLATLATDPAGIDGYQPPPPNWP